MGVETMFLDTTTMGITDAFPIYHTANYGSLEGNPCSSDVKDELITTLPSTSLMNEDRVPTTPNSCTATICGTMILSANAVLETETAPTLNLLQDHLSRTMDSVCNSHFPATKSPISYPKLLPDLLKANINTNSAEHGLRDFILADPPIFITWLHGGSAEPRPAGHKRGRPPRTSGEHSWRKVLLSFYDGRRRGHRPRSAAETLLVPWLHRPKRHRRGRPPNNYLSSCPRPNISFCILRVGHYLLSNSCYPQMKKGAKRRRPGESTMTQGASVKVTIPLYSTIRWDNDRRMSLRLVRGTLQRDAFFRAVVSATLFLKILVIVIVM